MMKSDTSLFSALLLLFASASAGAEEVVVLIDGPEVDLTLLELRQALATVPDNVLPSMLAQPKKIRDVMDSTYMAKVAATRAQKKGLDREFVTSAKIWNFEQNMLTEAELLSVEADALSANADFEKTAKEQYLARQQTFLQPPLYTASHILLKSADGVADESLLKRIEEIRHEIDRGEITFSDAAKKYSEDKGSASKGGSLGEFEASRMVKEFAEAVKNMRPGELGEPIKTVFGYHIALLQGYKPEQIKPFEAVKAELIKAAKADARKNIRVDYWLKVKNDPAVKVNERALEAFIAKPIVMPKIN